MTSSTSYRAPIKDPQPDIDLFIDSLMGKRSADPPRLVEYLVDPVLMRPILEDMIGRRWVDPGPGRELQQAYWDNFIVFWHRMGYDFVRMEINAGFQFKNVVAEDKTMASGQRAWADEHEGVIRNWEDFESYPWPEIRDEIFWPYEYVAANLPDGMGLIASHAAGVLEHLSYLFSYEGLCFALADQPDLVQAVSDRIGEIMVAFYKRLVQVPKLAAVFPGDDMGFRTATLIAPDDLRKYVLPWHKRFAEIAHENGLPYFLHSCGNLEAIMKDLIEDVRIDGKHSYEDAIIPVGEFQRKYGDRIAVLGGVDMDVLSSRSPDEVRRYVREIIDECGARGRFAIGSGNSIPSYVPLENYLTMIDEALRDRV